MHRIALDIDPIAFVKNILNETEPDPLTTIIMAELGGAESIVCYLRDDQATVKLSDIEMFKRVVKTHLTVRCNLTEEIVRNLIGVKVDMITFVSPGETNNLEPQPIALETYASQLQNYIVELRSNNILSSVLIQPNISNVKLAGKLGFDYVEIDATSLSLAQDMSSEIDALENIGSLALAANKLGMGVNISGKISHNNIRDIAAVNYIEDIVIGKQIGRASCRERV